MEAFDRLEHDLSHLREALLNHAIYLAVDSRERLRRFMEAHVFAVWDFMSLAKRLQRDLTCVTVPWVPPPAPEGARFINELVLGEESDVGPDGRPRSHLETYLEAMEEVKANTSHFRAFLEDMRLGAAVGVALERAAAPVFVRRFVEETLACALRGSTVEVAAAFLFGREDVIPDMFRRLLVHWDDASAELPHFVHYLRRHVELDAEHHAPLARRLLEAVAGSNPAQWSLAAAAGRRAIQSRSSFWDGVLASLLRA